MDGHGIRSIWDLCWNKRHWERYFLEVLRSSSVSILAPMLRTHPFFYQRSCKVLTIESVVKLKILLIILKSPRFLKLDLFLSSAKDMKLPLLGLLQGANQGIPITSLWFNQDSRFHTFTWWRMQGQLSKPRAFEPNRDYGKCPVYICIYFRYPMLQTYAFLSAFCHLFLVCYSILRELSRIHLELAECRSFSPSFFCCVTLGYTDGSSFLVRYARSTYK
jgi:hypothetical protein